MQNCTGNSWEIIDKVIGIAVPQTLALLYCHEKELAELLDQFLNHLYQ